MRLPGTIGLMLTAVVTLSSAGASAGFVESLFSDTHEGWKVQTRTLAGAVAGNYPVTWLAAGGDPDGFIRMTDPDAFYSFFHAPLSFTGDLSSCAGGALSFSIRTNVNSLAEGRWVVLESGGIRLTALAADPTVNQWTQSVIPLVAGHWHVGFGIDGPLASQDLIESVLGNVTALLIGAEYGSAIGAETVGLDSVMITPAPGALALLVVAAGVGGRRRRTGYARHA